MPSEISLQNSSIISAVEQSSPRFKLANAIGCFLCKQFHHAPVVKILTTAHRVCKMDFPVVSVINVTKRCSNSTFSHYSVSFPQQRTTNHSNGNSRCRGFNGCTQSGTTGADH